MSTPEQPSKQRPTGSGAPKPKVRVTELPDRSVKAKGAAPPPKAEPAVAQAVPLALPVPEHAFVFDVPAAFGVELVALPATREPKRSLLPKLLWAAVTVVSCLAMFFTGIQCGYWRAGRHYEQVLKKTDTQVAAAVSKPDATTAEMKKPAQGRPASKLE